MGMASELHMDQWIRDSVMAFQAARSVTTAAADVEHEMPLSSRMHNPVTGQQYMDWILESVLPECINMRSPRCLAHMANSVPEFISDLAQVLLPLNQNMAKRQASRAFSRLEEEAIMTLHKLVYGFSEEFYAHHRADESAAFGLMVSGGTLANQTAIWVARNRSFGPLPGFAGIEEEGAAEALQAHGYSGAAIIGSDLMHYSFDKAVAMAGFGTRAVSKLASDVQGRISAHDAEERMSELEQANRKVFALVGIAGTTDAGSIDPLEKLGELAHRRGVHFHVDAAWGAPILFSRRHRGLLRGMEMADTVTIDGHKQFHLPIGTSLLLFRDPRLAAVIRKRANYMLQQGTRDLGSHSPEGSRPAACVYLHAGLSVIGQAGYEHIIDTTIDAARYMARAIGRSDEFQLLMQPETNLVLYRYVPPALRDAAAQGTLTAAENAVIDSINERLQETEYRAGFALVSRTTLKHSLEGDIPVVALRAVISNPETTAADIDAVLNDQLHVARSMTPSAASCERYQVAKAS